MPPAAGGPNEDFREPGSGEIGESLTKTHSSFETPCGSYAHFKITRYLTRVTRDSRYGDSMERVLYNCILGALPIKKDGHGFYYSDYNNDGSKVYHPYKWHCCTGTFSQITADYGISSYFHDGEGIYVNLYVPSRVTWTACRRPGCAGAENKLSPHARRPQIAVATGQARRISGVSAHSCMGRAEHARLGQRQASWRAPSNRASLPASAARGRRATASRSNSTCRPRSKPSTPNTRTSMAPLHGPLALFSVGQIPAAVRRQDLLALTQVASGSTDWQAKTESGTLTLRPFAAIHDDGYRLYLNVEA